MVYYHFTDINECASGPCQNNGTCENIVNGFLCECVPPYIGDTCSCKYHCIACLDFDLKFWSIYVKIL